MRLTPTEWSLLEILVRHNGKLVPQKQLLTEVWGPALNSTPITCGSTSPSSAANSNPTPPTPAT